MNLELYLMIYNNEIIKNFKSHNLKATRTLPLRLTDCHLEIKSKVGFTFVQLYYSID